MEEKAKVYIMIDVKNRIIRCEGGYSMESPKNSEEWILVDEGYGDKYNLCQSHYFEGGLYTEDGICRYAYEDNMIRLRTEEEIFADKPEPA